MLVKDDSQIADMAEKACFYVTPEGQWLRMDYSDMESGFFVCHDEETFMEYSINFDDVKLEGEESFHELVKMSIPKVNHENT